MFIADLEIKFRNQFLRARLGIGINLHRHRESHCGVEGLSVDLKVGVEFGRRFGLLGSPVHFERAAFIDSDPRWARAARRLR